MAQELTLEQRAQQGPGADLVMEGGGVKGIGLAGAVIAMSQRGYVFPRIGGTSAGAIVAALVAAYQVADIDLTTLHQDMQELDYHRFMYASWAETHLGPVGKAAALIRHQGLYGTEYLVQWLAKKLEPTGVKTFRDLKITQDGDSSLAPQQRYRLVVHTTDLTRRALVRLPWDLPYYLLPEASAATLDRQIAAIDGYSVVDAVRASMSIPYFFRPFVQSTPEGECTWVDGGVLQNFPVTVFDRTDGAPPRWPTFGIKLSAQPKLDADKAVQGDIAEALDIAHTALGEWNRYLLQDEGVSSRTVYVDTMNVPSTDFALSSETRDQLYNNGVAAAGSFLAAWAAAQRG
jgi:NTE family protein